MKVSEAALLAVALAIAPMANAVAIWGQCGGLTYNGSTTCDAGLVCTYMSAYYSQCLAGTATSATSTTSKTSTTGTTTSSTTAPASTGFVKTSGQKFTLNGATFSVVGANAYWVGLMGYSTSDMNKAFSDIAAAGGTVSRTWGFNEVTSASGDYYQLWTNGVPTVNTGSTGLGNFDNVVAAAKANGIRLIVALTNNWSDYGGMDVYVNQLVGSGSAHDYFYTNAAVIAAYKNYIKAFVSRYVNEPTIMAWELSNEPRCSGSTSATSGTCTTTTITNWASTISAYIKSIDSNHLVAIGDEGFMGESGASDYPYSAGPGIAFAANLAISTLDFGTFHLYPGSWGETSDPGGWGAQWIADHATVQKSVGKPTIIEEFGVTTNQTAVYTLWYNEVLSSGLTGAVIWQAGSYLSTTTPNDGYAVYPDGAVYPLDKSFAASLKARG